MRARLYLLKRTSSRFYAVVFRGKQVGEVYRRQHERGHMYGHSPWEAAAWLNGDGVLHGDDYFIRRGDAKRWILKHQTEVPK